MRASAAALRGGRGSALHGNTALTVGIRTTHCFTLLTPSNRSSQIPLRIYRLNAARIVASLPPSAVPFAAIAPSAAAASFASLAAYVRGSIDPVVLGATASASFKLFLICAVLGWLLKTNRIPNTTAPVLSQVSFQLLIPCMLFSKVAATLAAAPQPTLLIGMAAAALTQIALGGFWGVLLSPFVDGRIVNSLDIFGWRPFSGENHPTSVIATATAAATGLPHAAAALLPRPPPPPRGLRELVAAACAFGNSFTLPCVFFLSLLPAELASRAIAYSGLFLLAWSPCLWSIGLGYVEHGFTRGANQDDKNERKALQTSSNSSGTSSSSSSMESSTIELIADQPRPSAWLTSLQRAVQRTLNPPILAIVAAMLVGLSPAGKSLLSALTQSSTGATAAAVAVPLPLELTLLRAALRNGFEVVEMLAGGTLAIQTLVLASSLLQRPEQPEISSGSSGGSVDASGGERTDSSSLSLLRRIWKELAPSDAVEARALFITALVRFLLLPVSALAVWQWAATKGGVLSVLGSDPMFLFVIAIQAVMPSAQNLIIALQISDVTRPAAPAFARFLLKLYAYSVLPVTLWVTAFVSRLAIPIS